MAILFIGVLVLIPYFILISEKKIRLVKIVGDVAICFAVGVGLSLTGIYKPYYQWVNQVSELSIAFALPLMLVGTDFKSWFKSTPVVMKSFFLSVLSVLIIICTVPFLFADRVGSIPEISGMLVGVYTGGSVNLSAIGKALGVSEALLIQVNSTDLIVGTFYFLFLISLGKMVFSKFLGVAEDAGDDSSSKGSQAYIASMEKLNFRGPERKAHFGLVFKWLLFSLVIVGLSVGSSFLILGKIQIVLFILSISVFSVLASFKSQLRNTIGSYQVGHYILMVFCVSLGTMSNPQDIVSDLGWVFVFVAYVVIASVLLHSLFAKLFKIDRDTFMITSCAGIFGPPFVPAIASIINNQRLIPAGIASGLVGYGIGNFIGIAVHYCLKFWF